MELHGLDQAGHGPRHGTGPLEETPRKVRLFLLKVGLFVSVWGALFFKGAWGRYGWWEAAWAVVLGIGLLFPAPFRPARRLVTRVGALIGRTLSWAALAVIYFLGLVPVGLVARMTGKKFMPLGKDGAATSYWEKRAEASPDKASMERQY